MKSAVGTLNSGKGDGILPRARLLAAAAELFYRHGIRAIGVDAVAEAADTNKMTLYRHFASKDELVAECLREFAREALQRWQHEQAHPGDPRAQIHAWLAEVPAFLPIEIIADAPSPMRRSSCRIKLIRHAASWKNSSLRSEVILPSCASAPDLRIRKCSPTSFTCWWKERA